MARASQEPPSKRAPRRPAGRRSIAAAKPKRSAKKATAKRKTTRAKVAQMKKALAKKGKAPAKKGAKTRGQAPVKKTEAKKKAPVKEKAPAPAPPVPQKKAKPEITPREIRKIKSSLEEQRAILLKEFSDLEEGSMISQSEASGEASFDEEFADAGSYTFEREKEMSIGQNIRDLVDKVNHALEAIERGRYGICERCGNPIAKARVLALPYSTLCMTCKQQEERMR